MKTKRSDAWVPWFALLVFGAAVLMGGPTVSACGQQRIDQLTAAGVALLERPARCRCT